MMNHPQRDDENHLLRLLAGVSFIVILTVLVILGPDGITALWNMMF